jgi:hypothetical protein
MPVDLVHHLNTIVGPVWLTIVGPVWLVHKTVDFKTRLVTLFQQPKRCRALRDNERRHTPERGGVAGSRSIVRYSFSANQAAVVLMASSARVWSSVST